jgi:hypothetical protein
MGIANQACACRKLCQAEGGRRHTGVAAGSEPTAQSHTDVAGEPPSLRAAPGHGAYDALLFWAEAEELHLGPRRLIPGRGR